MQMIDLMKKAFGLFTDENFKNKYKVISCIGALIRFGLLFILRKTLINELGITLTIITYICSFILNYLIEKPLYHFTFWEVGIGYKKGKNPPIGSLLYTIFYAINCAAIFIIIWFYQYWIYYICILTYIIVVLLCRAISYLITSE